LPAENPSERIDPGGAGRHTKAAKFCCDNHRVYYHKQRNQRPKRVVTRRRTG
jgi:hypothetical protein